METFYKFLFVTFVFTTIPGLSEQHYNGFPTIQKIPITYYDTISVDSNNVNTNANTNVNTNPNTSPNTNTNNLQDLEDEYFNLFLSNPYAPPAQSGIVPVSGGAAGAGATDPFQIFSEPLVEVNRSCPRGAFFASYNPTHKAAVLTLTAQYNSQSNLSGFNNIGRYFITRGEVHPKVWYSALLQAQLQRMPDTMAMRRPNPIELFPTSFFPDRLIRQKTQNIQECLLLDERFGRDNGIENTLWYFREDIQLNAHHWIWHLLYPINSTSAIDRRGEFFYFFHHDLLQRYTAERLSNNLEPPAPLNIELDTTVPEGYIPHLADGISTRMWAPRSPNQHLATVLSDTIYGGLATLVRNKNRLLQSLRAGTLLDTRGSPLSINDFDSINVLGELVEASNYTINPSLYGMDGYHNLGHWVLANIDGRPNPADQGVMGDVATSMRDPIFYRWHTFVDSIFLHYKSEYLQPYQLTEGEHPLVFDGITIRDFAVVAENAQSSNLLRTFWNSRRFNLRGGLDFNSQNDTRRVDVNICSKHLDHEEFNYQINIESRRRNEIMSVIRIYMAPRFKSRRAGGGRYTFDEQRNLFFAMDSFTRLLRPGINTISRNSNESTVSAPWPQSIDELSKEIAAKRRGRADCDCGFPHHLLLPKGNERGMLFDLFVMVTNGKKDIVIDRVTQTQDMPMPQCTPSHVHCGIQGAAYPDAKPMGYPFDRRSLSSNPDDSSSYGPNSESTVRDIEAFAGIIPNAATTQVTILHEDIQIGLEAYRQV